MDISVVFMSKLRLSKKVVKVCLHSGYAVQISLQFDEFFSWIILKLKKYFKLLGGDE